MRRFFQRGSRALAISWLSVALGMVSDSVETASNLPMFLVILPFLSSGFVPTDSMPDGLSWFVARAGACPFASDGSGRIALARHPSLPDPVVGRRPVGLTTSGGFDMRRDVHIAAPHGVGLKALVGSGDKIAGLVLPFLVVGVVLNLAFPAAFDVGGPSGALRTASIAVLIPGVAIWLWSALLILTRVPRGELIESGPYALVKHPLYTAVALLVIPWIGFLLNTWLGVVIGLVLYVATRLFAPAEEAELAETFGARWEAYCARVLLPWL